MAGALIGSMLLVAVLWDEGVAGAAGVGWRAGGVRSAADPATVVQDPAAAAPPGGAREPGLDPSLAAVEKQVEHLLREWRDAEAAEPGGRGQRGVAGRPPGQADQQAPGGRRSGAPWPTTPELSHLLQPEGTRGRVHRAPRGGGGRPADGEGGGSPPGGEPAGPPVDPALVLSALASEAAVPSAAAPGAAPTGPTPDLRLGIERMLTAPVRAYPPGPPGNDDDPSEPLWERYLHDRTERLIRQHVLTPWFGYRYPPEPPEPLLPTNAWDYMVLNGVTSLVNDAVRVNLLYGVLNRPLGSARNLAEMTLLTRPTWESPVVNTLWNMAVSSGVVAASEAIGKWATAQVTAERLVPVIAQAVRERPYAWIGYPFVPDAPLPGVGPAVPPERVLPARELRAMVGMQFHTGIKWQLIGSTIGVQVLGGLVKPLVQSPTFEIPELRHPLTGRIVPNPLQALPAPIGRDAQGHKVWASRLDYWLDKAYDAGTLFVPILVTHLPAVNPTVNSPWTTLLIATVTTTNKLVADVSTDLPPEGDPVREVVRAGVDPDPDSFGEQLWSFAANTLAIPAIAGPWLLLRNHYLNLPLWVSRAQLDYQINEAIRAGDWEGAKELMRHPDRNLLDPETGAAVAAAWDRAWAAFDRAMKVDTRRAWETVLQTPLLGVQMGRLGTKWLAQQLAGEVTDLDPEDRPATERLPGLEADLRAAADRFWRDLGYPPAEHADADVMPAAPAEVATRDPASAPGGLLEPTTAPRHPATVTEWSPRPAGVPATGEPAGGRPDRAAPGGPRLSLELGGDQGVVADDSVIVFPEPIPLTHGHVIPARARLLPGGAVLGEDGTLLAVLRDREILDPEGTTVLARVLPDGGIVAPDEGDRDPDTTTPTAEPAQARPRTAAEPMSPTAGRLTEDTRDEVAGRPTGDPPAGNPPGGRDRPVPEPAEPRKPPASEQLSAGQATNEAEDNVTSAPSGPGPTPPPGGIPDTATGGDGEEPLALAATADVPDATAPGLGSGQ